MGKIQDIKDRQLAGIKERQRVNGERAHVAGEINRLINSRDVADQTRAMALRETIQFFDKDLARIEEELKDAADDLKQEWSNQAAVDREIESEQRAYGRFADVGTELLRGTSILMDIVNANGSALPTDRVNEIRELHSFAQYTEAHPRRLASLQRRADSF